MFAGCSAFKNTFWDIDRTYNLRPSLFEWANNPTLQSQVPTRGKGEHGAVIVPTDADILWCANGLRNTFRLRMNDNILMRHLTSTFQVLSAASAGVIAAIAPSEKIPIAILAGSSAIVPQLQSVFDAKGQATALEQGASLIDQAEGKYYAAIAANPSDRDRINSAVTVEGANFYVSVVAAVGIVEKLLVAELPDEVQITIAKGGNIEKAAMTLAASRISVLLARDPSKGTLLPQSPVLTLSTTPQSFYSSNPDVATTSIDPSQAKVTLNVSKTGSATLSFQLKDGTVSTYTLVAQEQLSLQDNGKDLASPLVLSLRSDASGRTITAVNNLLITGYTISTNIANIDPLAISDPGVTSFKITPVVTGATTLVVKSANSPDVTRSVVVTP